jgi:5,5'-dehydrodivanillate O-demethylase
VPVPSVDKDGEPEWALLDNNSGEDIAAWVTQGEIADRSEERLGLSDKGIILYRQLLKQECEKTQRGEDPMNVFRDPAKNVFSSSASRMPNSTAAASAPARAGKAGRRNIARF